MIETNVYGSRIVGDAECELGRQLGSNEIDAGVNLSRIWREAGSPEGADPETWAASVGSGLVAAFAAFAAQAFPGEWLPDDTDTADTLWQRSGGMLDLWACTLGSWEFGDHTTRCLPLAFAYAIYLDRS